MPRSITRRRLLTTVSGLSVGLLAPATVAAAGQPTPSPDPAAAPATVSTQPIAVNVASGIAISAKSASTTPGDHVAVFNLARDGGTNNAALQVVSRNAAFSAVEITGHETGHGTLKISHVNPGPKPTADATAAAISIDLQDGGPGGAGGTGAQGIFITSTSGRTDGKIVNYADRNGGTIFAVLADGSLVLRPLDSPPPATSDGVKVCNVGGVLGVIDGTGTFSPVSLLPS